MIINHFIDPDLESLYNPLQPAIMSVTLAAYNDIPQAISLHKTPAQTEEEIYENWYHSTPEFDWVAYHKRYS